MKRMTLLLGAAAITAITAPVSARAQSCAWWNLVCNGLATRVVDNGWHIAGRDANGNVLYVRRRVDSNGNVVFEQSRRTNYGNYFVTNNHVLTSTTPMVSAAATTRATRVTRKSANTQRELTYRAFALRAADLDQPAVIASTNRMRRVTRKSASTPSRQHTRPSTRRRK